MNSGDIQERKVVGNIGVLDLRKTCVESMSSMTIGNVGALLYSRETAHLLARIKAAVGNLGSTIEAPADAKVYTGLYELRRGIFKDQESPIDLVVSGLVVVDPEVPEEEIASGLGSLIVIGHLVCPENLVGIIQAKTQRLVGKQTVYPPGSRLVLDSLSLDEAFLRSLKEGTILMVVGNLNIKQLLSDLLLEQKLGGLHVTGRTMFHEENAAFLLARMQDGPNLDNTTTIPRGHELIERPLTLNNDSLQSLPSSRLYCTRLVQVEPDTEPAALDDRLESLVSRDMVLCPTAVAEVIHRKCDVTKTQLVTYEGTLWLVDGVQNLFDSSFEFMEGKATLVVTGVVTISPDIEPAVLADRLAKVHNKGFISCTPQQMGAIQARLGISSGVLEDSTKQGEDDDDEKGAVIGNVGYLAL